MVVRQPCGFGYSNADSFQLKDAYMDLVIIV